MDEKQEKINQLLENNKRYYPTDGKGNIDEWGAVIKRQVEAFELQKQLQDKVKVHQMQNYGQKQQLWFIYHFRQELEKELQQQEDKKRILEMEKIVDRDNVQKEAQYVKMIEEAQKELERQKKQSMSEQLKMTIDQKNKAVQDMRRQEQQRDYENIQNALRQKEMLDQADLEKRRMQKELLLMDNNQSRRMRQIKDEQQKYLDMEAEERAKNNLTYFSGYEQRLNENQIRLKQFDENQRRIRENYNQYVASPQANKLSQEAFRQMRDQQEIETRNMSLQQQEERNKQLIKLQNQNSLNMQILQKQQLNQVNDKDILAQQMSNSTNVAKQMEEEQALLKKQKQAAYKEMLDQQSSIKNQIRTHGNMTEVEKQMNKDDLIAWKNYDNNQYSMIPGVSNQKKILDRSQFGYVGKDGSQQVQMLNMKSPMKNPDKFQEHQERMKQYGFSRDVRDVYSNVNKGANNAYGSRANLNNSLIVDQQKNRSNFTSLGNTNKSQDQIDYTADDLRDAGLQQNILSQNNSKELLLEKQNINYSANQMSSNRNSLVQNQRQNNFGKGTPNLLYHQYDTIQQPDYQYNQASNGIIGGGGQINSPMYQNNGHIQSQMRSSSINGGIKQARDRSLINAGNSILL
ncbi:UNKNOWN [Stylonychia lemnae]|uniref:Uncharacterized protein n=1 Tax=Stylonychia lemnae TaxID=5949 RepID=A0A077ZTD5_STYLE|nr:UNKNOWN [Stylonychia lemnae]|eukprot:CDW73158.1 UNKNOWN [Stylonychia lemnae]